MDHCMQSDIEKNTCYLQLGWVGCRSIYTFAMIPPLHTHSLVPDIVDAWDCSLYKGVFHMCVGSWCGGERKDTCKG